MVTLPGNEQQNQYLHNRIMIGLTTVPWLAGIPIAWLHLAWYAWLIFGFFMLMCYVWAGLMFWDMYLRPYFFPEDQLDDPDYFDLAFQKWLDSQSDKERNVIWKMTAQVKELQDKVAQLEGKNA